MEEVERKPRVKKELDKAQEQFDKFDSSVKEMTLDRMNKAPMQEQENQTKLSNREQQACPDVYLKPKRFIDDRQKFNERFQKEWEFDKEYVQFIAEHKEQPGDTIEMWTHKYGGKGAEYWEVPVNKPVWGPRYLAEEIHKRKYHRLKMENSVTQATGVGQFYGAMAVDTTIQRLDAYPINTKRSIFV